MATWVDPPDGTDFCFSCLEPEGSATFVFVKLSYIDIIEHQFMKAKTTGTTTSWM